MPSWPGIFQFAIFLSVTLCKSGCIFTSRISTSSLNSFFHIDNPFYISIMVFLFPYFILKLFGFFWICLLVCPCTLATNLLVEFSFVILECPIMFVLLDPIPISFVSPFFCQYFLSFPVVLSDWSAVIFLGSFHSIGSLCALSF